MIFTPEQIAALRTLVQVWSGKRFVLIGASALSCTMDMRWRETRDLDAALAVTFDRYPAGLDKTPGWSRHPKREQTWIAPRGVHVDVIPIGSKRDKATILTWPESGLGMSLVGLRLAFAHAIIIK